MNINTHLKEKVVDENKEDENLVKAKDKYKRFNQYLSRISNKLALCYVVNFK